MSDEKRRRYKRRFLLLHEQLECRDTRLRQFQTLGERLAWFHYQTRQRGYMGERPFPLVD